VSGESKNMEFCNWPIIHSNDTQSCHVLSDCTNIRFIKNVFSEVNHFFPYFGQFARIKTNIMGTEQSKAVIENINKLNQPVLDNYTTPEDKLCYEQQQREAHVYNEKVKLQEEKNFEHENRNKFLKDL